MSLHTMAYYQAATANAALAPIPAVADGTLRVVGNDVYIPKGLNNIAAVLAMINSAAATLRCQVQSPMLRSILNFDVNPIVNGLIPGTPVPWCHLMDSPLLLAENEPLEVWIQNGAAVVNQSLIWLTDGPVQAVKGKVYTVRAAGAATLAAGAWVNTALVFGQTLPAGHYQCVGLKAIGANLVCARLFFVGSPWRPGVPGLATPAGLDMKLTRYGNMGVLGEFDNTTPPTMDCFGVAPDAAQEFLLDLIKVS